MTTPVRHDVEAIREHTGFHDLTDLHWIHAPGFESFEDVRRVGLGVVLMDSVWAVSLCLKDLRSDRTWTEDGHAYERGIVFQFKSELFGVTDDGVL